MLMLNLITVVLSFECFSGELFIKFVGPCTDQLNQDLWERVQTLVNFTKNVMPDTNHRATAL